MKVKQSRIATATATERKWVRRPCCFLAVAIFRKSRFEIAARKNSTMCALQSLQLSHVAHSEGKQWDTLNQSATAMMCAPGGKKKWSVASGHFTAVIRSYPERGGRWMDRRTLDRPPARAPEIDHANRVSLPRFQSLFASVPLSLFLLRGESHIVSPQDPHSPPT